MVIGYAVARRTANGPHPAFSGGMAHVDVGRHIHPPYQVADMHTTVGIKGNAAVTVVRLYFSVPLLIIDYLFFII